MANVVRFRRGLMTFSSQYGSQLAELAWVSHAEIAEYVPYGLFEPVQDYLDGALTK